MKVKQVIFPKDLRILKEVGENIKLARLRRRLSTQQVSERASIGRMTLYKIERGDPSVSMGNYLQVLVILSLVNDLKLIAANVL